MPLYLNKKLEIAFTQLRADKRLGKSYAGLLCFVTGLHELGYLSEKQFVKYRKRYMVPLDKDPQQIMLEEVDEAQKRKQLNHDFGQVIKQWSLHSDPTWRARWLAKAKQHGDIPNAVKLLALHIEEREVGA